MDLFSFDEFGRLVFATSKRLDDLCILDILGEGLVKGPLSKSERDLCFLFFFLRSLFAVGGFEWKTGVAEAALERLSFPALLNDQRLHPAIVIYCLE